HLVIAQNLSSTLQRYAADAIATFDYVVNDPRGQADPLALQTLLNTFDFRYVALLDLSTDQMKPLFAAGFGALDADTSLRVLKEARPGPTQMSGVVQVQGEPFLILSQMTDATTLAYGIMDTDFLIEQQKAIAFGERGHAMIVDHLGRVLAHPNAQWTQTSKDASGLEVVQRMINGQTGVMQFFSPPLQADMIAGYTSVPRTGWGVMVPQPIAELRQAASVEASQVTQLLALSFLIATLASWGLSGLLTKPIESLSQVVTAVRDGDLTARARKFPRWTPHELDLLRELLNGLLQNWSDNNKMLEGSLKAAKTANARKSEALSVLSHEMRTPLNGIVGTIELFRNTDLTEDQAKYVRILDGSAKTLLGHVNNILEVSRLDAQTVEIEISQFDLHELLEEIVNENLSQAQGAGIGIMISVDEAGASTLESDRNMVRAIASNLISNAVKFTSSGHVKIRAKVTANDMLELSVSDTGPGIDPADLDQIFEPFTVINASYGRTTEGTGLGLRIAALAAEALGSKIEVKSTLGSGSEFRAKLPILRTRTTTSVARNNTRDSVGKVSGDIVVTKRGQSVLVVDDNAINREVLAELVRRLEHTPTVVADGPSALEIAMVMPFDLILLDISMPNVDGIEVARLLREHEGPNQNTRIVAQTAHASPSDHDAFAEAGMDSVLIKPITLEQLRKVFEAPSPTLETVEADALPKSGNVIDAQQFELLLSSRGSDKALQTLEKILSEIVELVEELNCWTDHTLDNSELLGRLHNVTGASAMLGAQQLHKILHGVESDLKLGTRVSFSDVVDLTKVTVEQTRSEAARIAGDVPEDLQIDLCDLEGDNTTGTVSAHQHSQKSLTRHIN
ncbi:MAG: response regulator, partial [Marinovum sp.]|nr:response regulator [Marinovum sp.]